MRALEAGSFVATVELEQGLREALGRTYGIGRMVHVERQPALCQSSAAMEELSVALDSGARLELMFKDLSPQSLLEEARGAKPSALYDPRRELAVYEAILDRHHLAVPRYYGSVADPARERYWLFIERVPGVAMHQVGEFAVWQDAARALARIHRQFAGTAADIAEAVPLLRYDADWYAQWPRRALAFLRDDARRPALSASRLEALQRVQDG